MSLYDDIFCVFEHLTLGIVISSLFGRRVLSTSLKLNMKIVSMPIGDFNIVFLMDYGLLLFMYECSQTKNLLVLMHLNHSSENEEVGRGCYLNIFHWTNDRMHLVPIVTHHGA